MMWSQTWAGLSTFLLPPPSSTIVGIVPITATNALNSNPKLEFICNTALAFLLRRGDHIKIAELCWHLGGLVQSSPKNAPPPSSPLQRHFFWFLSNSWGLGAGLALGPMRPQIDPIPSFFPACEWLPSVLYYFALNLTVAYPQPDIVVFGKDANLTHARSGQRRSNTWEEKRNPHSNATHRLVFDQ
ncbi:hypothetical protein BKA70DRAFT_1233532 [Coprinopsis sp. MPI-PUGE-AT-0042]|nr:hypothetical protein BKA70DRAFT_1233532 [Coprinopsis sp. MPI-PUGE-AT-0042]